MAYTMHVLCSPRSLDGCVDIDIKNLCHILDEEGGVVISKFACDLVDRMSRILIDCSHIFTTLDDWHGILVLIS